MSETAPTVEVGAVATVGVGGAATEEEALRIRAEVKGDTEVEGIEEGVIVPTEEEGVGIVPTEVVAVGSAIEEEEVIVPSEEEEEVHLLPPGELGREARNLTLYCSVVRIYCTIRCVYVNTALQHIY